MILRRLHRLALTARPTTPTLFARDALPITSTTLTPTLTINYFSTSAVVETGPAVGTECNIKLNTADPTPTIQSWDEYPDWLKSLSDTPETLMSLEKSYQTYASTTNIVEEDDDVQKKITMEFDRIVRLKKLTSRQKIKEQNETSNDLA